MSLLPQAGDIFSGCQILSRCGKGSFGITYLARNPLGKKIIIKIVSSVHNTQREMTGLRNYMQVSGTHPNLLKVHHIGEFEDGFYYTMEAADNIAENDEYLPATLGNYFRNGRIFSPQEAIDITRELLAAVQVSHQAGLIHRDIKPDNIIFVNNTHKLSDPGLMVQVGQSASFCGTVGFIPPEALEQEAPADQKFDLYAMGKVLYCLLTGLLPRQYPELPLGLPIEVCRQLYPVLSRACSQAPERRFKSAEEFVSALPVVLEKASWLDSFRDYFRIWRVMDGPRCKKICIYGGILLLLIPFFSVTWESVVYIREYLSRADIAEEIKAAREERMIINEQQNRRLTIYKCGFNRLRQLEFQLHDLDTELLNFFRKNNTESSHLWNKKEYERSAQLAEQVVSKLQTAAEKLLPELPDTYTSKQQGETFSGQAHSFLSTPLAAYLDEEKLRVYKEKLDAFDNKLYADWQGMRCGKDFVGMQNYSFPMIFVPSGRVIMPNKEIVKIPYHYWICRNEVLHEHFTSLLDIAPQRSPNPNTPVERVVWNDMIFFCYKLTVFMQQNEILPPGYIVRLPTEAEWEFAANNAWKGTAQQTITSIGNFRENSSERTWAPGHKKANLLGLYDMYGNVAELVHPSNIPVKQQHSAIAKGGSFRHSAGRNHRFEYLKYQNIPDNIGFRIVIAPGDMTYFDREFFSGGATQARARNKVYELIGINHGAFTWLKAYQFCELLGGRLAVFQDQEHIKEIKEQMPLLGQWLTFIGGIRNGNNDWVWLNSTQPINFAEWNMKPLKNFEASKYMAFYDNKFVAVANHNGPLLLCEWDDCNYKNCNQNLLQCDPLPFELTRFDYQNKRYVLFNTSLSCYAAQRLCELLGGRLACPDEADSLQEIIKRVEPFSNRAILLGAYAKRDKWFWLSGKQLNITPKQEIDFQIPSRNRNYLTLKKETLYNSMFSDAILCEWSLSSTSSR